VKLVCTGGTGADLPEDVLESSGNTRFSRFNVTVGEEYNVWAMALWTYGVGVLIVDDTGRPNWKLIDLFTVVDGQLPTNWKFAVTKGQEPVLALWGYPTLVGDPDHHRMLIERKISALNAFLSQTGAVDDPRFRSVSGMSERG
jgi:hypothetical protein